jgi:ABC-type antimicrobial peptide transport system permease subunit
MALGAQPGDVLWLVVRYGLRLAIAGGVVGVIGALAIGRALSSLLYGVSSVDVPAFAVAVALALVTASAACVLPARRAAHLDPLAGLRTD